MAATLEEILLARQVQPKLVAGSQELIEQEISDKAGISGADFNASGFGDYLVKRGEEASVALLSITDERGPLPAARDPQGVRHRPRRRRQACRSRPAARWRFDAEVCSLTVFPPRRAPARRNRQSAGEGSDH